LIAAYYPQRREETGGRGEKEEVGQGERRERERARERIVPVEPRS